MKILFVHNYHRLFSSSGDDIVVKNEISLLKRYGNGVVIYARRNSDFLRKNIFGKIAAMLQVPYSFSDYREFRRIIVKENPDVVHVHTFFPFVSPSIYVAANDMGKPIIQTLHDFRFFCANAFLLREGLVCEDCAVYGVYKAMKSKCVKSSLMRTMATISQLSMFRICNVLDRITMFVTFTNFGREKFSQLGIPAERILVKPHFLSSEKFTMHTLSDQVGGYFLFLGRLSEEKGIRFLLDTWKLLPDITLRVAGSGPLEGWVKRETAAMANAEYIGYIQHDKITDILKESYAVIVPSIWYETFGLVTIEAYHCGKPVIATNLGAMADLVDHGETGLLFNPKERDDLLTKVRWLWEHHEERNRMGARARKVYEEKYTPERNYRMLIDIYDKAIVMYERQP